MLPKLQQLVRQHGPEALRFIFVGGLATLIHYALYLLLEGRIGINPAYTIGYGVSLAFNYVLSNYFTFRTKPSLLQSFGFCLCHAINYGLSIGLLNLYVSLGVPDLVAPVFVFAVAIPVNFLMVRHVLKRW